MNIHATAPAHRTVEPAPQGNGPPAYDTSAHAPKPLATTWAQHIGAALRHWDRMTETELLQSGGHVKTLAGLIRERYMLSRAEADQQVRRFLREQC